MIIDAQLTLQKLQPSLDRFWKLSGEKIRLIEQNFDPKTGSTGIYGKWPIYHPWMDRVDTGISVWIGIASV